MLKSEYGREAKNIARVLRQQEREREREKVLNLNPCRVF